MTLAERLARALKPLVEKAPGLAAAYRAYRDTTDLRLPTPTPMGFKLEGNESMRTGAFEPVETAIVDRLLDDVDYLVNVGANVGYYCCYALMKGKHTIAFEPVPSNLRHLFRNLRANGWGLGVEVFPLAVSDRVGLVDIYGGGTGASLVRGWAGTPSSVVSTVPVSTLDRVIGSRLNGKRCLIVMDIEGAELPALRGAAGLLGQSPRPIWMVEISVGEHQPDGVAVNPDLAATFEMFWDRGYDSWTATSPARPVTHEEIAAIVNGGRDTLATHNFVFVAHGVRWPETSIAR